MSSNSVLCDPRQSTVSEFLHMYNKVNNSRTVYLRIIMRIGYAPVLIFTTLIINCYGTVVYEGVKL